MITARIHGGLGNQMFQYAAGRALSLHNNDGLRIDPSPLFDPTPWKDNPIRTYGLPTVFSIDPRYAAVAKIQSRVRIPYVAKAINKFYARTMAGLGVWQYIGDSNPYVFNPDFFKFKGDIYLDGYFQSEKYFHQYEPEIRGDFKFRPSLGGKTADLAKQISQVNAVSLFIRRKETVRLERLRKLYYVATPEYYERAIAIMKEKAGSNPVFYISSDEIDWCRENFKIDVEHVFVGDEHNGPECANALHLMTLCKHFIIPNSSFAWWAAWLSRNPGKVVVAPKQWLVNPLTDTRDVAPESWIKI